jgi:hypothetical protein
MPAHLKALVVILGLAIVVFAFCKAPVCAQACTRGDYERRRNLWIAVTLIAFLAHNFWVFIVVAGIVLFSAQRSEPNKLALFFFLLLALPRIDAYIPGLGLIANLFAIDYQRLLVLAVLFPAFLALRAQPDTEPLGRSAADKLVLGYLLLTPALMLAHSSVSITLRHGAFNALVDIFLPYYVASRSLKSIQEFRDALMAFAVAALVLSATLVFEFLWGWLLYASLDDALGVRWGWFNYMARGTNLRAAGPIAGPIAAGYVVAVGIGLFLYLRTLAPSPAFRRLGMALLVAGLIAPLSRGPWVGAAAGVLVFLAFGQAPAKALAKIGMFGVLAIPLLIGTPAGQNVIDHLPFVGTIAEANVEFRQRLADASIEVFLENPILGRYDYLESPAMEALRGGDGLIDMVNTYALVGLGSGLVGLSLFVGFFAVVLLGIFRGMRKQADKNHEIYVLGQALLAALAAILVTIGTVAPVLQISIVFWAIGGVGAAYARMLLPAKATAEKKPARAGPQAVKQRT